jgi:hypothetical protein
MPSRNALERCQTPRTPPEENLNAAQHQLLRHAHRAVAGMGQGVLQDRLLDRLRHAVGMRIARTGQPVDQPSAP